MVIRLIYSGIPLGTSEFGQLRTFASHLATTYDWPLYFSVRPVPDIQERCTSAVSKSGGEGLRQQKP